jgi:SAM-dependent methyltransferase
MSLLFDGVARLRGALGPDGRRIVNRLLYEAIYSLPAVGRIGFFNGGYHPPPPDMPPSRVAVDAPLQAALYDVALRVHPGPPAVAPRSLLDLGCGQGGGLLHAAALFPGARLVGADISRRAIATARRRLAAAGVAAELHAAPADRLPFPDAAFDMVVSVGTLTYVGYEAFLREAARVIAPGGTLSVTGGTLDSPLTWTQSVLATHGRAAGLRLRGFHDITTPCFAALQQDAGRHARALARLPRLLRSYAGEWAVLPGSRRHAMYLDGRKKEFAAVFAREG